jgi:3-hydroxybutyryl-CoA dehydrogenase
MGSGIAEVCARAGLPTVVVEADDAAAAAGRARIDSSMARSAGRGRMTNQDHDAAMRLLAFTADIEALADCDLVIEAIVESPAEKLALLATLSDVLNRDAVVASNTSSIPIGRLALATRGSERVIGLHFFNPVPARPLVEVIPSLMTSAEIVARVSTFAADVLGRKVVLAQDRAGFIVNALLIPYLLSAVTMFDAGSASADDIDAAMVEGCGHPMGPLALADLIGLDTVAAIAVSLYEETRDLAHVCPPLVTRMVEAGRLGRKTGRGFYEYSSEGER